MALTLNKVQRLLLNKETKLNQTNNTKDRSLIVFQKDCQDSLSKIRFSFKCSVEIFIMIKKRDKQD